MKYAQYVKRTFSIILSVLISLVILNLSVDPFEIFNTPKIPHFNKIKPDKARNERVTKIVGLKLEKRKIDSVFLGSSRVNSSISEDYYKEITNKITKNLGMNALSHDETFKIADNVILIHPELNKIYVGLDFFRFLEKNKDNKRIVNLSDTPKLTITELNPILLSFNAIQACYRTIIINIKYNPNAEKSDLKPYFLKKIRDYKKNYENAQLADSEFIKLSDFKQEFKNKGYEVIFYTNPTHAADLELIKQMGYLDIYFNWKRKLAEKFNYVDFNFINEITSEPINKNTVYFLESSHSTKKMGEVILNNLILSENDYGIEITKDNSDKYNSINGEKLKEWEIKNPYWVEEIKKVVNNDI